MLKLSIENSTMSFKGGRYCLVRECTNCEWRNKLDVPATSFFRIPKDEYRSKVWLTRAGREDLLHLDRNVIHNSYRICSVHFEDSAFTSRAMTMRRKLSCKAVPTIFNHSLRPKKEFSLLDTELSEEQHPMPSSAQKKSQTCAGNKLKMRIEQVDVDLGSDSDMSQAQHNSYNNIDEYSGHLCRLCAVVSDDLLDIFCEKAIGMSVVEKIHLHLPIEVTKDDDLPLQVCSSCILKLDVCTEIVSTSLESQSYLKKLFGLELPPSPNESEALNTHTGTFQNETAFSDICDDLKEISAYSDDVNRNTSPPEMRKGHEQNLDTLCYSVLRDGRLKHASTKGNMTPSKATPILQTISMTVDDFQHSTWKVDNALVPNKKGHSSDQIAYTAMPREIMSESSSCGTIEHLDGSNVPQLDVASRPLGYLSLENRFDTNSIEVSIQPGSRLGDCSLPSTGLPPQSSQILEIRDLEEEKPTVDTSDNQNECQIFDDLLENFIQHSKNNVVICESENNFNPPVEINWHELNEPELVCWLCHSIFTNSEDLVNHQRSAHPKNVLFCTKCKVISYEQKTFDEHTCLPGNGNQEQKRIFKEVCRPSTFEGDVKVHSKPDTEITTQRNFSRKKQSAKCFDLNKMAVPISSRLSKRVTSEVAAADGSVPPKVFPCTTCDVRCGTRDELRAHGLTHPRPADESRCRFCDKKFLNKYKVIDHERIHTREKPYVCEFCGKCFRVKAALTVHLYRHNETEKRYACDVAGCEKRYATKSTYNKHRVTHDVLRPYLCDVCGQDFRHNGSLQIHRKTHFQPHNTKTYNCDTCGKSYSNRYRLTEHMRVHTNERPYSCQTCGKQFHKVTQLGQHALIHANARNFVCQYCGKRFNRRGNMITHARRHERTHPFQCTACKEPFQSLKEVVAHRKTHTEVELKKTRKPPKLQPDATFKCDVCGKCLSCKATLQKHLLLHTGIKTHQCTKCDKSFLTRTRLTNHLACHSEAKRFTCGFCPEGFNARGALAVHERLHTGDRPFRCPHCSKGFRSRYNLQQHLSVHSDERPYPCPRCRKSFRRRGDLAVHVGCHADRRPFACATCDRRFARKADCKTHEQRHVVDETPDLLNNEAGSFNACFLCGHVCENSHDLNYHYEDSHAEEITSAPNMIVIDAESLLSFPEITVTNADEESLVSVLTGF